MSKKFKTALVLFLALVFASSELAAQTEKFGKIDKDLLGMKSHPQFEDSEALIIFDSASLDFNEQMDLSYHRHLRVKLLNEEAVVNWSRLEIPFGANQSITKSKARSYRLDQEGKMLKADSEECEIVESLSGENVQIKSFCLNSLEPGSIVEYSYTTRGSFIGQLPFWDFQSAVPTLWSEMVLKMPDDIQYTPLVQGVGEFTRESEQSYFNPITKRSGVIRTWAMQDLKAASEIQNSKDGGLVARLDFILHSFIAGGVRVNLKDSWGNVISDFHDNRVHGAVGEFGSVSIRSVIREDCEPPRIVVESGDLGRN